MKNFLLAIFSIMAFSGNSSAAIYCQSLSGGAPITVTGLAVAAVSPSCRNTSVMVTSALSSSFSNLSSATLHAWPSDRVLRVEKGGSIGNTTAFAFADGSTFIAGDHQVFTGSGTVTGLKEARPEWFGGAGDWTGSDGTDNLSAMQKAAASLGTNGGVVKLLSGTYRISNNWNITKSNVALYIAPSAHLFSNVTTTDGHTVAFVGVEGTQVENVSIYGGGKISNTSAGATENAVGFARAKNYKIIGMNIPTASRKGITAQVDCDYGEIRGNLIGTVGLEGIAVEGDSVTPYTEQTSSCTIDGNVILAAGGNGISVNYANASSPKNQNIKVTNNTVVLSALSGFIYTGIDGIFDSGNIVMEATAGRGFSFISCDNIRTIGAISKKSGLQGFYMQSSGVSVSIVSPSVASVGAGVDGIYIESPSSDITIINPQVFDSGHRYAVSFGSFTTYKLRLIGYNLTAGTSGALPLSNTLVTLNSVDDAVQFQTVAYAADVTIDYSLGSYVLLGALTGNIVINNPTGMVVGQRMRIRLLQDATGGRLTTFGTSGDDKIQFTGTLTTTANTVSLVELVYESTNRWRGWILFTGQGV